MRLLALLVRHVSLPPKLQVHAALPVLPLLALSSISARSHTCTQYCPCVKFPYMAEETLIPSNNADASLTLCQMGVMSMPGCRDASA